MSPNPTSEELRARIIEKLAEEGIDCMVMGRDVLDFYPILHTHGKNPASMTGASSLEELVQEYKIHLMPKDEDFLQAILDLCHEIKINPILQETISSVKVKKIILESDKEYQKEVDQKAKHAGSQAIWQDVPKIVIYIGNGQVAAQKALNEIYRIFKDRPGIGRTPRFNAKITNFIYFAQGDRTEKYKPSNQQYFEQPKMIYYKRDVTGKPENYHLIHPVTGREIVE